MRQDQADFRDQRGLRIIWYCLIAFIPLVAAFGLWRAGQGQSGAALSSVSVVLVAYGVAGAGLGWYLTNIARERIARATTPEAIASANGRLVVAWIVILAPAISGATVLLTMGGSRTLAILLFLISLAALLRAGPQPPK